MTHKDIRIPFEVGGRNFEAVGFLKDGESSVDGKTMLSRIAEENGGAIGQEDVAFLSERRNNFPKEIRRYTLATGIHKPGGPQDVSCFVWGDGDQWYRGWLFLEGQWDDHFLVLRRCA